MMGSMRTSGKMVAIFNLHNRVLFVKEIRALQQAGIEVKKLNTISPHNDSVAAPCEHAAYCGGCKTQNLAYDAQV